MNTAITILSALQAGLSAMLVVLVASPGVGLPPVAIVVMAALSAGLGAAVAVLAKGSVATGIAYTTITGDSLHAATEAELRQRVEAASKQQGNWPPTG